MQRISQYIISHKTEAIFDCDYKGQLCSIIYEQHNTFFIKKKPLQLIRESCRHYGWSYKERLAHTKRFFKQSHKLPIIIEYTQHKPCIFFPLYSPTAQQNAWLNLHAIKNTKKQDDYCAVLIGDQWLTLPATTNVFKTQYAIANLYARNCECDSFSS